MRPLFERCSKHVKGDRIYDIRHVKMQQSKKQEVTGADGSTSNIIKCRQNICQPSFYNKSYYNFPLSLSELLLLMQKEVSIMASLKTANKREILDS